MGFFDIGLQEIILILVVVLIVVGPQRLPEIATKLGKMVRNFRKMTANLTVEMKKAMDVEQEAEEVKKAAGEVKKTAGEIKQTLDEGAKGIKKAIDTETGETKKTAEKIKKTLDTGG
jgi:sec-independent protein translocase protein TatB